MHVKEKTIIVTGGGNGLGREIVLQLLSRGSNVIAIDINPTALEETKQLALNYQSRLTTQICDISNKKAIENLSEKIKERHTNIDGIINNAGIIQPFIKLENVDFDVVERIMNINFFGMLYMTKIFLPQLKDRSEAHIVNIASMGGFLPVPGQTLYCASKAAVKLLSEGLQAELKETNVGITIAFPGALRTNIKMHSGINEEMGEGKALSPQIAAQTIIKSIEHRKKQVYIGNDSLAMNMIYRIWPSLAVGLIYKQIKHKI